MARPLMHGLLSPPEMASISSNTALLLTLASIVAISSMVIHLCTTHKRYKMSRKKGICPGPPPNDDGKLLPTLSGIGSKALVAAKMVACGAEEDEEELWRKTILMGDKCRPLVLSGQIMYDGEGNQLPPPDAEERGGGGRRC